MLKVKMVFKELDLAKTIEQKKEVYKEETGKFLVASTKSYNNLVDSLKAENKIATESEVKDLFLDKEKTRESVAGFVAANVKDEGYYDFVTEHIMKALDGACVFKKPPVVRKKA